MLQLDAEGNVISESEFKNFFCLLVAAGLHALANQPGLLADLQSGDESVWSTLPDEVIRWASPATYFRRTATRNGELHGKTIRGAIRFCSDLPLATAMRPYSIIPIELIFAAPQITIWPSARVVCMCT